MITRYRHSSSFPFICSIFVMQNNILKGKAMKVAGLREVEENPQQNRSPKQFQKRRGGGEKQEQRRVCLLVQECN